MIAGSNKGAHVTIREMSRAALALSLVVVASACAPGTTEESSDTTEALGAVQDRIEELEDTIADLRAELDEADAARDRATDDLTTLRKRFRKSLGNLRESLGDVRSNSASSDEVATALAAARAAAADLRVLKERYDYHLRRYHGGG